MTTSEHGVSSSAKLNSFTASAGLGSRDREPGVGLLEPVSSLVMDGFDDPPGWLDGGAGMSLVDHPLLRGLLMELPPKGSQPSPEWMNRWFEAARAVLDLIYNRR